jgi:hypothetical protein
MKRTLLALALVAAGTTAFADGATYDHPTPLASSVTRAEVRADAVQAQRNGQIANGEATVVAEPQRSTLTRVQVAAEVREAQRLGLLARGEVIPEATPAQERAIQLAGQRATATQLAAAQRRACLRRLTTPDPA